MTVRISKKPLRTQNDPEIQGHQSWPGLLTEGERTHLSERINEVE